MHYLQKTLMGLLLIFFTACGEQTAINPNNGFDMWEYMTSASNYEVNYSVYENNVQTDSYVEIQKQYGDEFERISTNATTRLLLGSNTVLIQEPDDAITAIRYLDIGDKNIFQSPNLELCTLERFYPEYQNRNALFYNVLQVQCQSKSGVYQELYYGYNEGIVHLYENNQGFITEYLKTGERAIF